MDAEPMTTEEIEEAREEQEWREKYCASRLVSEPVDYICERAPGHNDSHRDGPQYWDDEAARDLDPRRN